ncbi:MAG: agmatine deiminase family protein [Candidatus Sedimenticola sp. 20ELBAFRAG]
MTEFNGRLRVVSDVRRLPAEWEVQDGVMLTWPHGLGDWAPYLPGVEPVFVAIAREIAKREKVVIVCGDETHRVHAELLLQAAGVVMAKVQFALSPSNDTWARDHGPITVLQDGTPRLCDFTFDGWGEKYPADLDNRITSNLQRLGMFGELAVESVDLVLEGGGIESDGEGTLLATSRCLLNERRNTGITREGMEKILGDRLGIGGFLWLEHGGLCGDDTDGHIDTLARFCDRGTIAYQACSDVNDANHSELKRMASELKALRDTDGEPYRLVALPSPAPIRNAKGDQLPASYANFLVINGAVLVPTYDDPADGPVLEKLAGCFPGREIVAIDCRPLLLQYGSLHCVTMQLPQGVLS